MPGHGSVLRARPTYRDQSPNWPEAPRAGRPNIVVIVLDDVGYADLGCFGSEISTPAIDSLARDGLRFANFTATPLCSPTRAALHTGRNPHRIGMRFLSEVDTGFANTRGRISPRAATMAQVLRQAGYHTAAIGKWHLAPLAETTDSGPFDNWPLRRGFDQFYGFMGGVTDQYTPELVRDNHHVPVPDKPGYHLSEDLAAEACQFIGGHVATTPGRPFFLYLAFGAAHAPHQAPREYVEPYHDVFAKGWDQTRRDRLRRQIERGIVPDGTSLTERHPDVRPWESLGDDERWRATRLQAAYAGFIEHTDAQIGRVLAQLDHCEVAQDTLVLLMSDNGASAEGGERGAVQVLYPYNALDEPADAAGLEVIGSAGTAPHYPAGWAMAGNTPYRRYKQHVDGGGVNVPLIIRWPGRLTGPGSVRQQFCNVIDLAPTLLDVAGLAMPDEFEGVPQLPVDGSSLVRAFCDPADPGRSVQHFEMLGHRAIYRDGWKALTRHLPDDDYETEHWSLYHVSQDRAEVHDLSATRADLLAELIDLWWEQAERFGVLPLDDRPLQTLIHGLNVVPEHRYVERTLRPGTFLPFGAAPGLGDRSFSYIIELNHSPGQRGVAAAHGSRHAGYRISVDGERLWFEYYALTHVTVLGSSQDLPAGRVQATVRFTRTATCSGLAELIVDGQLAGSAEIPRTLHNLSFCGLRIGRDSQSPVNSRFNGQDGALPGLIRVTLSIPDDTTPGAQHAEALMQQQ